MIPTIKLNNGQEIPALGLGTWKSKPGEVTQAVKDAIDAGYRHIDCAFNYLNEAEVGEAIQTKMSESVVKRSDLFIVSKLWNTFHRPDLVKVGLQKSMNDLQLDYQDLYLIHWPTAFQEGEERYPRDESGKVVFSDIDFVDTWKAMEELVSKGLVKSIGVSNFNSQQLERLLNSSATIPVINQIEVHPYMSQIKLVEFCQERQIQVTAYSPLRSPDRLWENEPTLLEDPKLLEVANKYKKSVAQIIIRWVLQRDIAVIPKSVNKIRIMENFNVFDFRLSDEDMQIIFGLDQNRRANTFAEQAKGHKEYPFEIEF